MDKALQAHAVSRMHRPATIRRPRTWGPRLQGPRKRTSRSDFSSFSVRPQTTVVRARTLNEDGILITDGLTMPTKRRNQVLKGKHGGMQLLLTDDVPHLGKQGDLVEVKAGYGRNYLLPQGLATVPSAHNLKLLELHKKRVSAARESKIAD